MLIMDQRTMQVKYRIPATEIFKLSLSPYQDDIAVFHVKAVSITRLDDLKFKQRPLAPRGNCPET